MKKIYFFFIAILATSITCFAAPKIKGIANNGTWKTSSTWDLNRIPVTSDTVIVPLNKVLVVDNPQTLGNVYIQVYGTLRFTHGKLTLGSNSVVVVFPGGTITGNSNSEKIRIGAAEVFNGSDPDVLGPSIANSTTGAGFNPFTLPVKFVGFEVTKNGNDAVLQWATAEEQNASHYEIERSLNGSNWIKAGEIKAAGNTNSTTNYTYTDKYQTGAVTYYRIKQIDVDGKFIYTAIKTLKNNTDAFAADVKITAVQGNIVLQFPARINGAVAVRFVTPAGQIIESKTISNAFGQVVLTAGRSVKGNLFVSVDDAKGLHVAKQIML